MFKIIQCSKFLLICFHFHLLLCWLNVLCQLNLQYNAIQFLECSFERKKDVSLNCNLFFNLQNFIFNCFERNFFRTIILNFFLFRLLKSVIRRNVIRWNDVSDVQIKIRIQRFWPIFGWGMKELWEKEVMWVCVP